MGHIGLVGGAGHALAIPNHRHPPGQVSKRRRWMFFGYLLGGMNAKGISSRI